MKVRESGMPVEKVWNDFFDVELILSELSVNNKVKDIVEIGCGYGTFSISAARRIRGNVLAYDIEKEMIDYVSKKAESEKISNIRLEKRDVLAQSTGLAANSVDYMMLFNILHHEKPQDFFDEAYRILKPKGKIGIIHWRSDIETPRGPCLSIRPKPEQIIKLIDYSKFVVEKKPFLLKPYHFGILLSKI